MIVRQFLHWLGTAPNGERADATSALARAYLYSELSPDDLAAAEGAMLMLLDDPSPLVRLAMAEALGSSDRAPAAIIHALAGDQADVAAPVLRRSPLLLDADLVDLVATGSSDIQVSIAHREILPRSVAAAIAEIGGAEACLVLVESPFADIAPFSVDRIVARFGHLAAIREVLLARDDLAVPTRQALVAKLSQTLANFVTAREWIEQDRAQRIAKEACEKATVVIAAGTPQTEVRPLIRHLRETGQLTAGLVLRALLSGNIVLFEEALADLAEMPLARVDALVHDRGGVGFRALYDRAGLPASTYPAFREALMVLREGGFAAEPGGASRLKRRMIERVLTGCESQALGDIEPLLMLLRRFATEAAREEARMFCTDLVAEDAVRLALDLQPELVAA
jgi:uncharacterized protein (DUF2336 family)